MGERKARLDSFSFVLELVRVGWLVACLLACFTSPVLYQGSTCACVVVGPVINLPKCALLCTLDLNQAAVS